MNFKETMLEAMKKFEVSITTEDEDGEKNTEMIKKKFNSKSDALAAGKKEIKRTMKEWGSTFSKKVTQKPYDYAEFVEDQGVLIGIQITSK